MFKQDQKTIELLCRSYPIVTMWTMIFVLVTIRTPFFLVLKYMNEVKKRGAKAKCLNSKHKNAGYKYIRKHYKRLHKAIFSETMTDAEKMVTLFAIPNIGPRKAGFILQLCVGRVGCIDCHNENMFTVDPKTLRLNKSAPYDKQLAVAQLYIDTCDKIGTSEYLWDNWCKFIGLKWDHRFPNGALEVSALHVQAIVVVLSKSMYNAKTLKDIA
tara:strand:+ start:3566 stop:4204 length:639 start_codon:yes stop_codon:yes gene_type:complete